MKDCAAKVFITSAAMGAVSDEVPALIPGVKLFMVGGARGLYESFEAARDPMPTAPIADEAAGSDMLYSSGTTGRPKGVKPQLTGLPIDAPHSLQMMAMGLFGFTGDSV